MVRRHRQDAANAESSFVVQRKTGSGGVWADVLTAASNRDNAADATLTGGTTYVYRIKSRNIRGDSPWSNEVSVTTPTSSTLQEAYLGAPTLPADAVQAENYDVGGEGVSWNDSGGNAGQLYRSGSMDVVRGENRTGHAIGITEQTEWIEYTVNVASAGSYRLDMRVASRGQGGTFHVESGGVDKTGIVTVPDTGSYYAFTTVSKDVTLAAGTQVLRFFMEAEGANGRIGHLDRFSLSVPTATVPTTPAGLAVTAVSTSQISLRWDDNPNETAYHVFRRDGAAAAWVQIGTTSAGVTQFVDSTVGAGGTYWYGVAAVNAAGASARAEVGPVTPADGSADDDGDGLTNQEELDAGTNPDYFDSDGDLLPDGWEDGFGLDPLDGDQDGDGVPDADDDNDGEGLDNLDELINDTDPTMADTDADGATDAAEVNQGSDPTSAVDEGKAPPDDMKAKFRLTVGDSSGSRSERWRLRVGSVGHESPGFGEVGFGDYFYKAGKSYDVTMQHVGTDPVFLAGWGDANYDWTAAVAQVETQLPYWIDDPESMAPVVGGEGGVLYRLLQEWIWNVIGEPNLAAAKTAHLHIPLLDADVDSDNNNTASGAPGRTEEEDRLEQKAAVGKHVFVNSGDLDDDRVNDLVDFDGIAGAANFVPLVISLSQNVTEAEPTKIEYTFRYEASDPPADNSQAIKPGALRIWKKDASAARVVATEYIGKDTPITAEALGLQPGGEVTLYIEAVGLGSAAVLPITVEVKVTGDKWSGTLTDKLHVMPGAVDADVDSDNNNGFSPPAGNDDEEKIEDVANNKDKPGKLVVTNDDDGDSDGIPDFADGFNWDGTAGNADDAPPTAAQGERFVPMIIRLSKKAVDLTKAWLKIEYNDSDPRPPAGGNLNGLTRGGAGTEASPYTYTPEAGDLRLWTKDASARRNWRSFSDATPGDYVHATNEADAYFTPTDWGKFTWADSADGKYRETTLWVEAISPGTQPGDKRISVKLDPDGANGLGFVAADAVRFTNTQVAVVTDAAGDHTIDNTDPATGFGRIGHWGADVAGANGLDGFDAAGAVRNNLATAANRWDNFIDRDPDRLYIRIIDPTKNGNAGARDTLTVTLGTRTAADGVDDDQTTITLRETGNNTGVFVSEAELLTAPDLAAVAAAEQDDGFAVRSDVAGAVVADDAAEDRTHKTTIDGVVRIEYGATPIRRQIPVSRRGAANERRVLEIRARVFMDPWTDANGNGVADAGEFVDINRDGIRNTVLGTVVAATAHVNAQVDRATIAWAQAGIKVRLTGGVIFQDAPNDAGGTNIIADESFDTTSDRDRVVATTASVAPDVLELFFVPNISGANAFAAMSARMFPGVGENSFAFIGLQPPNPTTGAQIPLDLNFRTLAHEIGHVLENVPGNDGLTPNPPSVYFPANRTGQDDTVRTYRRLTHATEGRARTERAAGALGAVGNRLLKRV